MGEDKKTLTIFSSLAKNSVKFFSQKGFTSAFSQLFATSLTSTATAATRPLKRKKLPFTVVNACGRWYIIKVQIKAVVMEINDIEA